MMNCPSYVAASYCCGDLSIRKIVLVNGEETSVNGNCWNTLRQICAQEPGGNYWVDALCINQRDLEEKAVQVHRIAAIFTGATEVWACYGPDDGDSNFLMRTLQSFPPQDASHPVAKSLQERSDDTQRRTLTWLLLLGDDLKRFAAALKAFGRRPFFSRMWIYQEMFLASKVRMVCGDETADMHALKEIELVCSTLLMSYRPRSDYDYKDAQLKLLPLLNDADLFVNLPYDDGMSALSVLISQIHRKDHNWRLVPFGDTHGIVRMQSRISTLRCEDARDKVFAIINMFDESCKILPDYTISEFDLALQVLDQYGRCDNDRKCVELAAYLCLNLRLRLNAPTGAKALLRDRNLASHYRGFLHGDKSLPLLRQSTTFASQVSRTTGGQMTAPFSL